MMNDSGTGVSPVCWLNDSHGRDVRATTLEAPLPQSRGSPCILSTLRLGAMTGDSTQPGLSDTRRFEAACRGFDSANSLDPNLEIVEGVARPRELIYAERLTHWVVKLVPDASEELRLAARCQH